MDSSHDPSKGHFNITTIVLWATHNERQQMQPQSTPVTTTNNTATTNNTVVVIPTSTEHPYPSTLRSSDLNTTASANKTFSHNTGSGAAAFTSLKPANIAQLSNDIIRHTADLFCLPGTSTHRHHHHQHHHHDYNNGTATPGNDDYGVVGGGGGGFNGKGCRHQKTTKNDYNMSRAIRQHVINHGHNINNNLQHNIADAASAAAVTVTTTSTTATVIDNDLLKYENVISTAPVLGLSASNNYSAFTSNPGAVTVTVAGLITSTSTTVAAAAAAAAAAIPHQHQHHHHDQHSATPPLLSGSGGGVPPHHELNNYWALLALVLVVGTAAGNILVCLAITWERRLQNVTNYFLMSLAITDLMVAILVMPLGILTLVYGHFPLHSEHCLVWICLDVLFCTASIMHLCTISVDRYLSLRYPMKFGRNKTRRRVTLKIIFVWLLSIAMSLPLCLMYSKNHASVLVDGTCQIPDPVYKLVGSIVCFYIPLGVMLLTYCLTVQLLARQQQSLGTPNGSGWASGWLGHAPMLERRSTWKKFLKSSLPSTPTHHAHSATSTETDLSTLDTHDLWLPESSIPEPTPSTMTALHQFGAEMLKLSRRLESFPVSPLSIAPHHSRIAQSDSIEVPATASRLIKSTTINTSIVRQHFDVSRDDWTLELKHSQRYHPKATCSTALSTHRQLSTTSSLPSNVKLKITAIRRPATSTSNSAAAGDLHMKQLRLLRYQDKDNKKRRQRRSSTIAGHLPPQSISSPSHPNAEDQAWSCSSAFFPASSSSKRYRKRFYSLPHAVPAEDDDDDEGADYNMYRQLPAVAANHRLRTSHSSHNLFAHSTNYAKSFTNINDDDYDGGDHLSNNNSDNRNYAKTSASVNCRTGEGCQRNMLIKNTAKPEDTLNLEKPFSKTADTSATLASALPPSRKLSISLDSSREKIDQLMHKSDKSKGGTSGSEVMQTSLNTASSLELPPPCTCPYFGDRKATAMAYSMESSEQQQSPGLSANNNPHNNASKKSNIIRYSSTSMGDSYEISACDTLLLTETKAAQPNNSKSMNNNNTHCIVRETYNSNNNNNNSSKPLICGNEAIMKYYCNWSTTPNTSTSSFQYPPRGGGALVEDASSSSVTTTIDNTTTNYDDTHGGSTTSPASQPKAAPTSHSSSLLLLSNNKNHSNNIANINKSSQQQHNRFVSPAAKNASVVMWNKCSSRRSQHSSRCTTTATSNSISIDDSAPTTTSVSRNYGNNLTSIHIVPSTTSLLRRSATVRNTSGGNVFEKNHAIFSRGNDPSTLTGHNKLTSTPCLLQRTATIRSHHSRNSSVISRNSSRNGRIIRLEQKATKVLGVVFFTFVILWAPFFVLNLLPTVCSECEASISHWVFDFVTWLGYASSMVNPIFYTIFNKVFRQAFKKVLLCQYGKPVIWRPQQR